MKKYEAVIQTLERLGGTATLGELYTEVFKAGSCSWRTKTPMASIRRIVQLNREIYKIRPGLYGLLRRKNELEQRGLVIQAENRETAPQEALSNHTYYQGLLVKVGNLMGLCTYVPPQDKNKLFLGKTPLGSSCSLTQLPPYSYPETVRRSSSVDVVWINERGMPRSLFEVEHSTDIRNSLLKLEDLQDFHCRMVIVADKQREREIQKKLQFHAFERLKKEKRISFLGNENLVRQYEFEVAKKQMNFIL